MARVLALLVLATLLAAARPAAAAGRTATASASIVLVGPAVRMTLAAPPTRLEPAAPPRFFVATPGGSGRWTVVLQGGPTTRRLETLGGPEGGALREVRAWRGGEAAPPVATISSGP